MLPSTALPTRQKGEIILNKKQHLQLVKQLLSKSSFHDRYTVRQVLGSIEEYRKHDLSPGETASELIDIADTFKLIHKIVRLEESARRMHPKPREQNAPLYSPANPAERRYYA